MPVYIINPGQHLIRAASRAQALRFIAEKTLVCEVAKGETIAELMKAGVPCQDARAPETAELPLENGDKPTSGNPESHTGQSTPSSGGPTPAAPPTAVENLNALDRILDDANREPAPIDPYLQGITDRHNEGSAGFSREAWPEGEPIDNFLIEGIDHVS